MSYPLYHLYKSPRANRLKMIVEKIISKPQNSFIRGKQILDSLLI